MARLKTVDPANAAGRTKELFTSIEGKLGMVPNMMRTMASSNAFLEAYLNLSGSLAGGTLGAKTGELIALAVAEANSCAYCLSAHSFIGTQLLHIPAADLEAARLAESDHPKTAAALVFARTLVNKKGLVNEDDVSAVKTAGVTDGEIGEIIGHVALNIMTNYLNNTAETAVDFPLVEPYHAAVL